MAGHEFTDGLFGKAIKLNGLSLDTQTVLPSEYAIAIHRRNNLGIWEFIIKTNDNRVFVDGTLSSDYDASWLSVQNNKLVVLSGANEIEQLTIIPKHFSDAELASITSTKTLFESVESAIDAAGRPIKSGILLFDGTGFYTGDFYGAINSTLGINSQTGEFYFGDNQSRVMWIDGQIVLKGAMVQSPSGDDSFPIPFFDGVWLAGKTYYRGSEVTHNGSTWVYTHYIPLQGQEPTDESPYWALRSHKGDKGEDGSDAQIVRLSASSQVFSVDKDGVSEPSEVTLLADTQNIDGAVSWSSLPPNLLTNIVGNSAKLTYSKFGSNTSAKITASYGDLSDTITIVKLTAGADGESVYVEYSVDGNTSWSSTYNSGYKYMRIKKGNEQWSSPVKIVGEDGTDGAYTDYQFAKNSSLTVAPNASDSNWGDEPPSLTSGEYLWMRSRRVASDRTVGAWSYTRLSGEKGQDGYTPVKDVDYFDGTPGQDGKSTYLWIRYSQSADGNPMTAEPSGAKYVGVATTETSSAPSGYSSYKWSLIKGTDGVPGEPGTDGKTSYLHIKYSNDGGITFTGNSGEDVGTWIGTYVDFIQADSSTPSAYIWNKVKGDKGDDGRSVAELQVFKRSANPITASPSGGSFNFDTQVLSAPSTWSTSIPTGVDPVYVSIGIVSKVGNTGSATPTWSVPAKAFADGADGTDGQSINMIFRRFATQPNSPGNSSNIPTGWSDNAGTAMGTGILWASVGTRATPSSDWVWQKPFQAEGVDGEDGKDAKLLSLSVDSQVFKAPKSGDITPSLVTLQAHLENIEGSVVWTTSPVVTLAKNGNTATLTSAAMGSNTSVVITAEKDGYSDSITIVKVVDGSDGSDGKDAFTVFLTNDTHAFPASSSGVVASGEWVKGYCQARVFCGATQLQYAATIAEGKYTVSASVSSGLIHTSATVSNNYEFRPTGMTVDSALVTLTITARSGGVTSSFTKNISYTKSKAGYTPQKNTDYFDGQPGQDGKDSYLWVRYSQNSDGSSMTDSPVNAKYIGVATTQTASAPSTPSSYQWSLMRGTDGIPGEPGVDGKTSYLHIKYSNDAGSTFTSNNGEDVGDYIGTYVDFTQADSNNPSSYAWNKVHGEDAYNAFLTNENHTYPADESGNIQGGMTPGNTQVIVTTGDIFLTCDSTSTSEPTVDGTYRVISTQAEGITVTTALVPNKVVESLALAGMGGGTQEILAYEIRPQSMTSDKATVTLTIAARLRGRVATFNKTISYSKSRKGQAGISITSVVEKYLATSLSSGVTTSTSGWTDAVQAIDATKKYLWNYEVINYSDDTNTITTPVIIGTYGDKGSDGRGISSITNYYLATSASSGVSTSTSGWKPTVQQVTASKKYLWNYEEITYKNPVGTEKTEPTIIGVYGDKGDKGDTGASGQDAITILLSNESHTFAGNISNALASSTVVNIIAYKGTTRVASTIGTITGHVNGLTTSITDNGKTSNAFTVSATTALKTANGVLTIPITVDGKSFIKNFSFAVSFKGSTGNTGASGTDAKVITLTASAQIFTKPKTGAVTPSTITVTGTTQNTTIATWQYSTNGGAFTTTRPSGVTRSGNVVTINGTNMNVKTITVKAFNGAIQDTVTIAKVEDGVDGAKGDKGDTGGKGDTGDRGPQGNPGPGIIYRGDFSSNTYYFNTAIRRDAVKYNNVYYLFKGANNTRGAWKSSNWDNFGATYDSVATKLLLAEDATITKTLTIADGGLIKSGGSTIKAAFGDLSGLPWLTGALPSGAEGLYAVDGYFSGQFAVSDDSGRSLLEIGKDDYGEAAITFYDLSGDAAVFTKIQPSSIWLSARRADNTLSEFSVDKESAYFGMPVGFQEDVSINGPIFSESANTWEGPNTFYQPTNFEHTVNFYGGIGTRLPTPTIVGEYTGDGSTVTRTVQILGATGKKIKHLILTDQEDDILAVFYKTEGSYEGHMQFKPEYAGAYGLESSFHSLGYLNSTRRGIILRNGLYNVAGREYHYTAFID